MITNRVLTSAEAAQWGLVTDVVPDAELAAGLDELAARIASAQANSNGCGQGVAADGLRFELSKTRWSCEARLIAERAESADGQEGVAAFLASASPTSPS